MVKTRAYSRYSVEAASLFGKQIKLGRKQRKWTESELAERMGVSRATIQKIENGDMSCALGFYLEGASLVGIKLFESDNHSLTHQLMRVDDKIALLPKSIKSSRKEVNDDF